MLWCTLSVKAVMGKHTATGAADCIRCGARAGTDWLTETVHPRLQQRRPPPAHRGRQFVIGWRYMRWRSMAFLEMLLVMYTRSRLLIWLGRIYRWERWWPVFSAVALGLCIAVGIKSDSAAQHFAALALGAVPTTPRRTPLI